MMRWFVEIVLGVSALHVVFNGTKIIEEDESEMRIFSGCILLGFAGILIAIMCSVGNI